MPPRAPHLSAPSACTSAHGPNTEVRTVHAAANDRADDKLGLTSLAGLRVPDLHGLSSDPLTMCLPSGEYATERTLPSAPSACTPAHSHCQTKSKSGMARAACTDLLATRDVPDSHGVVAALFIS